MMRRIRQALCRHHDVEVMHSSQALTEAYGHALGEWVVCVKCERRFFREVSA